MNGIESLCTEILTLGASNADIVPVAQVSFEPEFRKLCEQNVCGSYGRNWMCPPHVGAIDELIARARSYETILVYQLISELEDSYDFEGMMEANARMHALSEQVRLLVQPQYPNALLLGAGGCTHCARCAKLDDQPCRFPEKAMPSMEAFGINVSTLAPLAGMKYINGANTVTYFGAVLI